MRTKFAVIALFVAVVSPLHGQKSARAAVEAMFKAFNAHDAMAMSLLYSGDAVLNSSDFCHPLVGRIGVLKTYRELFHTFPDVQDEAKVYIVEGENVAVRFIAHLKVNGRTVNLPIFAHLKVHHGTIVRDESFFNPGAETCRE